MSDNPFPGPFPASTLSILEAEVERYRQTFDDSIGLLRERSAGQQRVIDALTVEIEQHRAHAREWRETAERLEHELGQERRGRVGTHNHLAVLQAESEQHRRRAEEAQEAVEQLEDEIAQERDERAAEQLRAEALQGEVATLQQDVAATRRELDEFRRVGRDPVHLRQEIELAKEATRNVQSQLSVIQQSSSWRLTAPLRKLMRRLGAKTTEKIFNLPQ